MASLQIIPGVQPPGDRGGGSVRFQVTSGDIASLPETSGSASRQGSSRVCPIPWKKSGKEGKSTVQERWGLVGVQGTPGNLSPGTGQFLGASGGVVGVKRLQEATGGVVRLQGTAGHSASR